MSSDTKAIIGTIVAVAVALGGLFGGLLTVQFSGINARFDDVNARIDDLRTDLSAEIATVKADLSAEITMVRGDLRRFDDRLRAVEVAFGKVDQRLETLERLHLPSPDPGE